MRILITGATGYIGKRLIPILLNEGHSLVCTVRDIARVEHQYSNEKNIEFIEADFLKSASLQSIPTDVDIAYYLIHSMSNSAKEFHILEERCAFNFKRAMKTQIFNRLSILVELPMILNFPNIYFLEKM